MGGRRCTGDSGTGSARTQHPLPEAIGVSLSGGGFRASFFALGALRYLAEAGVLGRVRVISAVSGGSIAAGFVAARWSPAVESDASPTAFVKDIYDPFRAYVTGKNIRNSWARRALIRLPRGPAGRGAALASALNHHLYSGQVIADLPPGPCVILNATDLATGEAFRMSRDFVGSHAHGYEHAPPHLTVATAAAASAAFPASTTAVRLRAADLGLPLAGGKHITLVDGGVYDNLGIDWFFDPTPELPTGSHFTDFVVAVDASGRLQVKDRRYGALGLLRRVIAIQYEQTMNPRVRSFTDLYTGNSVRGGRGAFVAISHDPRYFHFATNESPDGAVAASALPSELVWRLPELRTDLDRFDPLEADLLAYHAYWSLHTQLSAFAPELAVSNPTWAREDWGEMSAEMQQRVAATLARGSHSFLRRIRDEHGRLTLPWSRQRRENGY